MRISMIAAVAENGVIGGDNALLWRLPADLKYFKQVTLGKPIVMGRKTYESIGKPLPGRTNIVITRQKNWQADGVEVAANVNDALALAKHFSLIGGVEEVMVIGGAQIYKETLPLVQRLYLTQVHASFAGDAYFPELKDEEWTEVDRADCKADPTNLYNYSFITLDRISRCV